MTTHSVGRAAVSGTDNLHLDIFLQQFDADDDDWYVVEQAAIAGHDPQTAAARRTLAPTPPAHLSNHHAIGKQQTPNERQTPSGQLSLPPGFTGYLTAFVYQSAPRPVTEVAVVAALGLLSGICGREWNIPGSGLNLYIILVARSAIGKEAMHSGIGKVLSAVRKRYPQADEFVCFDDFASGQALVKGLLGRPSFVNVCGEIGHKFQAMAKDSDPAHRSLRKALTNTYTKSAFDAVAGGIVYSNAENNALASGSAAYSLIGETTPGTFFESLTVDMMRDGFMSRFNVIEYTGERPPKNAQPLACPEPWLADHIAGLMHHAHTLRAGNRCQPVGFTPEAEQLLNDFELECDRQIRAAGDDESQRQMWNRAHLKALRIAGLLAVADRHLFPFVSAEHALWSIDLIRRDIAVFGKRLSSGEVGEGTDDGREQRLLEICRDYLQLDPTTMPDYVKPWNELRRHGLVPRKYLQLRTQRIAAFEKHPRGQREALNRTIQTAIDNGHFQPLEKAKTILEYGFQGQVFAILNTGTFPSANWTERFLEDCKRLRAASQM